MKSSDIPKRVKTQAFLRGKARSMAHVVRQAPGQVKAEEIAVEELSSGQNCPVTSSEVLSTWTIDSE